MADSTLDSDMPKAPEQDREPADATEERGDETVVAENGVDETEKKASANGADEEMGEPEHRFEDDSDPDDAEPDKEDAPSPKRAEQSTKPAPTSDAEPYEAEPEKNDVTAKKDAVGKQPGSDDAEAEGDSPASPKAPVAPPWAGGDGGDSVDKADSIPQNSPIRFERIVSEEVSVSAEATRWLGRVLTEGPRAVAEILTVVVSPCLPASSSAVDIVSQQMVMANDPLESVAELCENLVGEAGDAGGELVASKRARSAYQEFWMRVAREASNAILFDTDCFDTILSWLEVMSTAKISMLRYSACLAAYSIVDGLIFLGNKLRNRLVSLQRQLETEKKRCSGTGRRGRRSAKSSQPAALSQKAKELAKKVDDLSANNGELIELSDKVFTGIFALKYRDMAPDIRLASVQHLGKWIMSHSEHFLDDTHSKYIGWLLSDKDPTVRRACVTALADMLCQPDFFSSLELFLRRFLPRIVEMCRDKDNDVCIRAIRVCSLLIPYDILDQESVDQLCDQVLEESHSGIRKAAGHFVMCLITDTDPTPPTSGKIKKGDKDASAKSSLSKRKQVALLMSEIPSLAKAKEQIRELVLVVSRDGTASASSELVHDAMWDVMPSLRSWEAYAALLSEGQAGSGVSAGQNGKSADAENEEDSEEPLSEEEKALVSELLLASAKYVVEEGDKLTEKQLEKAGETESCEDALARIFVPLIPRLLVQFQGSARALAALVQVPRYFAAKHFGAAMEKKHFVSLLSRLVDAISRHTGSVEVMHATIDTFRIMSSNPHPLHMLTGEALLKASIAASSDLRQLVAAGVEEANPITAGSTMLKTRVISELTELPSTSLDDVLLVITAVAEKDLTLSFNTTMVVDACHTAVRQWIWAALKMRTFSVSNRKDEDFAKELADQADKLWKSRDEILTALGKIAKYPFNVRVRTAVTHLLLTVLTLSHGIAQDVEISEKTTGNNIDSVTGVDEVMSEAHPSEIEKKGKEANESRITFEKSVLVVKECLIDLIIAEVGFPSRNSKVPKTHNNKRGEAAMVSEEGIATLCTALVQACVLGAVPEEFGHLPFLALLLNRKNGTRTPETVCKLYRARVQKESESHGYVVAAIRDVAEIQSAKRESKHHAVALLARALIDTAPEHDDDSFYVKTVKSLLADCEQSLGDMEKSRETISILSKSLSFLVSRVSLNSSAAILVAVRELEADIKKQESLQEEDRSELAQLLYPLATALEAINSGEPSQLPHLAKLKHGPRKKRVAKRARPKVPRLQNAKEWEGSPRVAIQGSQEVRRSTRARRPRVFENYDEGNDDDDFEEAEDGQGADEEDESDAASNVEVNETPSPVVEAAGDEEDEANTEEDAGNTGGPVSSPEKANGDKDGMAAVDDGVDRGGGNGATPKRTPRRRGKKSSAIADNEEAPEESEQVETPKKRGRGRPRKTDVKAPPSGKKRGRPRKNPVQASKEGVGTQKEDMSLKNAAEKTSNEKRAAERSAQRAQRATRASARLATKSAPKKHSKSGEALPNVDAAVAKLIGGTVLDTQVEVGKDVPRAGDSSSGEGIAKTVPTESGEKNNEKMHKDDGDDMEVEKDGGNSDQGDVDADTDKNLDGDGELANGMESGVKEALSNVPTAKRRKADTEAEPVVRRKKQRRW